MNEYNDRGEPHGYWEHRGGHPSKDFTFVYMGKYNNGQEIGLWLYVGTDGELKEFYL